MNKPLKLDWKPPRIAKPWTNWRLELCYPAGMIFSTVSMKSARQCRRVMISLSVWLAQLVKALAAPAHVHSCVQEARVQSPGQTISTQDSTLLPGVGEISSSQYVDE